MSQDSDDNGENAEDCNCTCGDCGDEQEVSIKASLGGLELDVSGPEDSAEETFERVWKKRLEEAETMSDAMRARMLGYV